MANDNSTPQRTPNCNESNCVCPAKDCPRHGKCCECINHHRANGGKVTCMR